MDSQSKWTKEDNKGTKTFIFSVLFRLKGIVLFLGHLTY